MVKRFAVIAMIMAASSSQAANFGGLQIGMTQEQAVAILSRSGEIRSNPYNLSNSSIPQVLLNVGSFNAAICHGRVVAITHQLSPSFATWSREMRVALAERGEPSSWSVSNNEADPEIHGVRAVWDKAIFEYGLSYTEVNGQVRLAAESISTPCK